MSKWQPIETAPKNGTSILIAGGIVYYDAGWDGDEPFSGVVIAHWEPEGWWGGYGYDYDANYWYKPTHWMPLPLPPVQL